VAHRRRWRARCFASAAHLPMLAGGRGPHIIRPASSVLGRGTGLAGRGMSAGLACGRPGRSPCPDSPTARSSRSVPPRGWSRRAHRDADPGPAPNSVDRGDHRRLSVTAVFAHLFPLPLSGAAQPILSPLTALPDVQVSLYQTLRSAVHRVAAVARLPPPRPPPPPSGRPQRG